MRSVVLVPGSALGRARSLGLDAGWKLEATGLEADVEKALAQGAGGRPVLFVPRGARIPRRLRRILIPHEGSPAAARGVEVADALAGTCGAALTVLHVPSFDAPAGAGSFPAPRFVDRPHHDWSAWRREFERRFCRCTEGVQVSLRVATGSPAPSIVDAARSLHADLIVLSWKGDAGPGRAETLKRVLEEAPCPVLVVAARRAR